MESQLRAPNSQPLTNLAAVLEHQHHLILLGRRRKGAEMLHTCWPDSLWSQWELCLCTNSVPRCKNEGDRVLGKYFPCTVCAEQPATSNECRRQELLQHNSQILCSSVCAAFCAALSRVFLLHLLAENKFSKLPDDVKRFLLSFEEMAHQCGCLECEAALGCLRRCFGKSTWKLTCLHAYLVSL